MEVDLQNKSYKVFFPFKLAVFFSPFFKDHVVFQDEPKGYIVEDDYIDMIGVSL